MNQREFEMNHYSLSRLYSKRTIYLLSCIPSLLLSYTNDLLDVHIQIESRFHSHIQFDFLLLSNLLFTNNYYSHLTRNGYEIKTTFILT